MAKVESTPTSTSKKNGIYRSFIEWGVIIAIGAVLYLTGLHTPVIGTLQKGLLATGLIKPSIPEISNSWPIASREFYFVDEDSRMHSLENFEGDVVFMNIWATWCPPCIAEMPSIHRLYQNFEDSENISFVLVSMDEDFEKAKKFMADRDFDMPIYHFRNKAVGTYESTVIPTTYIITPDGKLALQKNGLAKYDTREFEEFLRGLM